MLLGVALGSTQLILVSGLNEQLGLSNELFVLGDSVILTVLGQVGGVLQGAGASQWQGQRRGAAWGCSFLCQQAASSRSTCRPCFMLILVHAA